MSSYLGLQLGGQLKASNIDNDSTANGTTIAVTLGNLNDTLVALQTSVSGKAATIHSHDIEDITNLQTTLDGKASSSHTHTIAQVTNLQTTLDSKYSVSNPPPAPEGVPTGFVMWYAANTAPTGFLKANGAAVSRTTYADLFAAIGTTFGAGDGSTTFNVPDLRGEFIRGWDDGRGIDSGRVFGSTQADANKAHTHSVALTVWSTAGGGGATSLASGVGGSNFGALSTGSSGGTEARPRNITLLACIKF